ncbi:hypothetical protein VPH35_071092 [Triticum aestivum]
MKQSKPVNSALETKPSCRFSFARSVKFYGGRTWRHPRRFPPRRRIPIYRPPQPRPPSTSTPTPTPARLLSFHLSPPATGNPPVRRRNGRHQRRRCRPRARASPQDHQDRAAAQGQEALRQGHPAVPRLRPRRRLRPLQCGGDGRAGEGKGAGGHRPKHRHPGGHLRAHRAEVGPGAEARHRRGRRGDRRRLPRPCGRRALQPLGGGLRREAWRPRCADDRPGDRDAGGRRGGGPRRHPPRGGRVRVHRRLSSPPW